MKRIKLFGPTQVPTTPATGFTNLVNTVTKVTAVTVSTPAGAAATLVRLSVGADAVGTRVMELSLAAGPQFITAYPGWILSGTETLQHSTTGTTLIPIIHVSGEVSEA